jgi:phosphoglycerol transferase MdoB-like AlkP superfamily enzyme
LHKFNTKTGGKFPLPVLLFCELIWWFIVFLLGRFIFLIFNFEKVEKSNALEILQSLVIGWKVDLSMAAYFLSISVLLLSTWQITGKHIWLNINRYFNYFFLFLVSVIHIAELPIYKEWNHKLTFKAIWFLRHPTEVLFTANWAQLIFGTIGIGLLVYCGIWLFGRIIPAPRRAKRPVLAGIITLLIGVPIVFTAARGGWSPIPIQISEAYYSENNTLNAAASNSAFHLMSNILQNLEAVKPYKFMPTEKADSILKALYHVEKDTTIHFLNTSKPNICLVVFEGWAADVVEGLGGYKGMAPNLTALIREGISFDSCYASGNLSDQGMGAIFSAFPAQPRTSIVTIPSKYPSLPSLVTPFSKQGYRSSFKFGGQLIYGNIKSYIYHSGFNTVKEVDDFPSSEYRGRLGVHDDALYKMQLQDLKGIQAPFFAAMFTQSTHAPYDIPKKGKLTWGGAMNDYLNAVQFADSVLGDFIRGAKKEPWFKNTLFVFVSDHHHNTPKDYNYVQSEYRRIPLVFYGPVIKPEFRGKQYHRIVSQLDLASTLLHQLDMDASAFKWSKNLMNPYTKEFAFYSFDEGLGWKRPEGQLVYMISENRLVFEEYVDPFSNVRLFEEGKAYLQRLTEEFDAY